MWTTAIRGSVLAFWRGTRPRVQPRSRAGCLPTRADQSAGDFLTLFLCRVSPDTCVQEHGGSSPPLLPPPVPPPLLPPPMLTTSASASGQGVDNVTARPPPASGALPPITVGLPPISGGLPPIAAARGGGGGGALHVVGGHDAASGTLSAQPAVPHQPSEVCTPPPSFQHALP